MLGDRAGLGGTPGSVSSSLASHTSLENPTGTLDQLVKYHNRLPWPRLWSPQCGATIDVNIGVFSVVWVVLSTLFFVNHYKAQNLLLDFTPYKTETKPQDH